MTEAGWYEDPEQHGRGRRYWDGAQWTEHYEFAAPAQQQQAPQPVQQQVQQPVQQLPPAGWKDDPEGGPGMRYWDGSQWTDHYHPPRDAVPVAEQPSVAQQQAPAAQQPRQTSSLDETQIDVRGYHGGRPEEPESAAAAAAAVGADPAASAAPAQGDAEVDYGTAGEPADCGSCGAKIRSSHRYCPACGVKQANAD